MAFKVATGAAALSIVVVDATLEVVLDRDDDVTAREEVVDEESAVVDADVAFCME